MSPLDTTNSRALQQQLEAMKRQVLDELRAWAPSAQAARVEGGHDVKTHADEAEAERAADVHLAEAEVDRTRLGDIERALARLATGHYGICEDCDGEIPRARLLAQPAAIRCTACQAAVEAHARP
ncbi:MAG: TraR/DksA family transcriptional regulator [Comamonadaceae bacterium]|nr:MAG: TraR/DksA family transcriptional regulator [Comamonadaceae bacterium]